MSIANEKYLSFTTYRKNGDPKAVPVWIADLGDGTLGFTTSADSWKVKRLANDQRVQLQPCDSRGKTSAGDIVVDATAAVVALSDPAYATVDAAIGKKYGLQRTMIQLGMKVRSLVGRGGPDNVAVIVTVA